MFPAHPTDAQLLSLWPFWHQLSQLFFFPPLPPVINVTLPDEKQNYVHRIGRVGRAERWAHIISTTWIGHKIDPPVCHHRKIQLRDNKWQHWLTAGTVQICSSSLRRMGLAISLVAMEKEKVGWMIWNTLMLKHALKIKKIFLPVQVWYHVCPSRGRGCYNTQLKEDGGCTIWYNEKEVKPDADINDTKTPST